MSRTVCQRLLAGNSAPALTESTTVSRNILRSQSRLFSSSATRADEPQRSRTLLSSSRTPPPSTSTSNANSQQPSSSSPASPSTPVSDLGSLGTLLSLNNAERSAKSARLGQGFNFVDSGSKSSIGELSSRAGGSGSKFEEPHHFHIYASRHNCHITLTTPERNPLISVSCGNIGFRKAGRKHYDSAFQLASYVMGKIRDKGLHPTIKSLEVTLRGFGAGREAVTKALLGTEGSLLRNKIVKVSDATRLKFGGTRSKKPRRLG